MINLIIVLSFLSGLCGFAYWKSRRDRKAGRTEEKLKQSEKVLGNVKKAKDAVVRLDDDKRAKLRKRYPNIK